MAFTITDLRSIPLPIAESDGAWHGSLTLTGSSPEASFEAIEELLLYYSRFAATGAFAISLSHVGQSRFSIDVQRIGNRLAASIDAYDVQPGAWRVLLQMLWHCREMEPFDAIELVGRGSALSTVPNVAAPSAVLQDYPPVFAQHALPLAVGFSDLDESLTLSVSCRSNLTKADLASLARAVDDWGSLVYVGGFTAPSVAIDAPLLDKPNVVRQGWSAFDVNVPFWTPNADAAASLLNLLLAQHARLSIEWIQLET